MYIMLGWHLESRKAEAKKGQDALAFGQFQKEVWLRLGALARRLDVSASEGAWAGLDSFPLCRFWSVGLNTEWNCGLSGSDV